MQRGLLVVELPIEVMGTTIVRMIGFVTVSCMHNDTTPSLLMSYSMLYWLLYSSHCHHNIKEIKTTTNLTTPSRVYDMLPDDEQQVLTGSSDIELLGFEGDAVVVSSDNVGGITEEVGLDVVCCLSGDSVGELLGD